MSKYFILDTETTGLGPDAEAWEVAVICCDDRGNELSSFRATCKPQVPWEEKAMQMSGLQDYELDSFQTPEQMLRQLTAYFRVTADPDKWDNTVVIHNVAYDAPLLERMYKKYKVESFRTYTGYSDICTMQALRMLKAAGRWSGKCSLEVIHKLRGTTEEAHTALADCKATAWLFFRLIQQLRLNWFQRLIKRLIG